MGSTTSTRRARANNAGFALNTQVIESLDGGRTPTYRLSNPWPNGIQAPTGSSLGPETFLGRSPNFSNPDFIVPNVHQFSVGVQRELPWRMSLEVTYAGKPQLRPGGRFQRLQRAVGRLPAAVRRHAGRQPYPLRPAGPEPVLRRRRLRGHEPVHGPDDFPVRAESPVPRVCRHHPEPEQRRRADLRLVPVRGQQALGEGRDHQRQLHVCAALERGRWLRGCGFGTAERYRLFLASPTSLHGVRCVGTAVVPRRAQHSRLPPWRVVDCAGGGLSVRPAVGHARQRRPGAGHRPQDDGAGRQEGRAVHLRRQAVHRRVQHGHGPVRSGVGVHRLWVHRAVLPDSPNVTSAARR